VARTHDFAHSLALGERLERELDTVFEGLGYDVEEVDRFAQRRGVDRIFRQGDILWTVEYKANTYSKTSGKFFIETTSVDRASVAGWAQRSQAQVFVFLVPSRPQRRVIAVDAMQIKRRLSGWLALYDIKTSGMNVSQRGNYRSSGILVPLEELAILSALDLLYDAPPN
jgi:Holliday junction resolvase